MKKKVISFVLIITMLAMFVPSGVIDTTVFAGDYSSWKSGMIRKVSNRL